MKALLFLADGCEEVEALTPLDMLRRADVETITVSIMGRKQIESSHKVRIEADTVIEDLSDSDFDEAALLILPGGMPGTKNLEACEALMKRVDEFFAKGKKLGAICAAPSILGHRGILKGKRACAYPGFEKDLEQAEVVVDSPCVVDGNIITARGMGCGIHFGRALIGELISYDKADEIMEKIVYMR